MDTIHSKLNAGIGGSRNAANIRHHLTGGEMVVVLKAVILLSKLLNRMAVPPLSDIDAVLKKLRDSHWKRKT